MTAAEIWAEFVDKLRYDCFNEEDFHFELRQFMRHFLSGESRMSRRNSFIKAKARFYNGEKKRCVVLACSDGEYRFDFLMSSGKWQLCFIETITLPVENIRVLPCDEFKPLPDKETWIRAEKAISKTVYIYNRLKKMLGTDEALTWFKDGAGEFINARSWVPFYGDGKAFIAYCAWMEHRIYGENIVLEAFTDSICQMRIIDHLWFKVYHVASHIKTQIEFAEYSALFEYIWRDRADCSGWEITFEYVDKDTVLTFTKQ